MESIDHPGRAEPCPDRFNMAAYVLGRADDAPDKVALAILSPSGAERWRYARLAATVRGAATVLRDAGVSPCDRVLIRIGNTPAFPIIYLAAILIDALPVPTSAQLTVPEISRIAEEIEPALIVADAETALPDPLPCPVLSTRDLTEWERCLPAEPVLGSPDRPAYLIYTSGTSGVPRAVIHAHRAVWARRMMWQGWYGLRADDRVLHAGAFNWTYTIGTGLIDPWSVGATALVPGPGVSAAHLPLLLKRHDATLFAAAPGVYRQLLRAPMPRLPKLRHGFSAGEALPEATRDAWQRATGTAIYEAFGMSECSTFVSGSPSRPAPPGTTGYAQRGRHIAVLGETGPVPRGSPGILAVHESDPGLCLGYWRAEADYDARRSGPWFLTGDLVRMADDGAIDYLGRRDDMMNAGGYRVSPLEVEHALNTHPDVSESGAVELRVGADKSVIAVFYVADAALEEAALAAYLSQRLARYKCPRIFRRCDALPRNANGKIQRAILRRRGESSFGQT
ncbi:MAG: acyl-CoA synthetase [Pseudomonadota bacterium]